MRAAHSLAAPLCVIAAALCCRTAPADTLAQLAPGFRTAVLEVRVNGTPDTTDLIALRDSSGGLWLAGADLLRLRLRVPAAAPHLTDQQSYYPLAAIAGARVHIDEANATASIIAPPAAFTSSDVTLNDGPRPAPTRSGTGLFLNYTLFAERGDYAGATLSSAATEAGFFTPLGVLTNTAVLSGTQGEHRFVRLDSSFTHDFTAAMQTLRLGDAITVPGSWGGAVRFGGLQWGTNYGIRPDLVTTPLLAAAGTAVVPSTIDVYINGRAVGSSEVPAGPFIVNQVPALTGAGDVSIVVRNALGQQQLVSLPFYSSPLMLREGLTLYNIDVGVLRRNYALTSADYGPLLATATWRRGMTDELTGELHAEALHGGPRAAGLDVARSLDHWAILSLDLAAGGQPAHSAGTALSPQPASSGTYAAAGLEHMGTQGSLLLQVQHASRGFRDTADYDSLLPPPRERCIAQAGVFAGRAGTLQAAFVAQRNADASHQHTASLSYQVNAGRGNFSTNVSRTRGGARDDTISVFYVLPLDSRRNTSSQLRYDSAQVKTPNAALLQSLQRSAPLGVGDGYLLSAGTDGSYQADYQRQEDSYRIELEAARFQDLSAQRLTVSGGATFLQGEWHASRAVLGSFAAVDVGGIPNMTVYFDNQPVARTDARGLALIPNLRPFEVNRLSIDPLQLPLDAVLSDPKAEVIPPYRSGVVVHFAVRIERTGVFRLRLAQGGEVPPGAIVHFQGADFPVGLAGMTYVTGYDHGTSGTARWNGGECRFRLPPPPAATPQPDLGVITCTSTP